MPGWRLEDGGLGLWSTVVIVGDGGAGAGAKSPPGDSGLWINDRCGMD